MTVNLKIVTLAARQTKEIHFLKCLGVLGIVQLQRTIDISSHNHILEKEYCILVWNFFIWNDWTNGQDHQIWKKCIKMIAMCLQGMNYYTFTQVGWKPKPSESNCLVGFSQCSMDAYWGNSFVNACQPARSIFSPRSTLI